MKKILAFLLSVIGLSTACSQKNFESIDVKQFAELIKNPDVTLLDVRTPQEYAEGHIEGAILIDVKQDDFMEKARKQLPVGKTIAVYCRSGRRSTDACNKLMAEGYKVEELKGGITAWQAEKMPVTKE